jgi:hypothetical protein
MTSAIVVTCARGAACGVFLKICPRGSTGEHDS